MERFEYFDRMRRTAHCPLSDLELWWGMGAPGRDTLRWRQLIAEHVPLTEQQRWQLVTKGLRAFVPSHNMGEHYEKWVQWAKYSGSVDDQWKNTLLPVAVVSQPSDFSNLDEALGHHLSRQGMHYTPMGMLLGIPNRDGARHVFQRLSKPLYGRYLPWPFDEPIELFVDQEHRLRPQDPVPEWSDFPVCTRAQYYWAKLRRHLKLFGVGGKAPDYLDAAARASWEPWGYWWQFLESLAMVTQENVRKVATDPAFEVAEGADLFEEAEREHRLRIRKRARGE